MKFANTSLFAAMAFALVVTTAQAGSVDVTTGPDKFEFSLNVTGMEGTFDTVELVVEGAMNQDPAGGDGALIMDSDTDSGFKATLTAPPSFGGQGLSAFGVDETTDTVTGISGTFASLGSNDASNAGYALAQVVSPGGQGTYRWEFFDDGNSVGSGSGIWGIPEPTTLILAGFGVLSCIAGRRRS